MTFVNKKLEEFENDIKNKKVAIIGLGVSNLPLVEYLFNLGSNITLFNNKQVDEDILEKIEKYNLKLYTGEDYLSNLKGFDYIFRSPSCMPDKKEIIEEVERGAILTSEIEKVIELNPGKTIAITGSDRKNDNYIFNI